MSSVATARATRLTGGFLEVVQHAPLNAVESVGVQATVSGLTSQAMGEGFHRGFTNGVIAGIALEAYKTMVEGMTPTEKERGVNTFGSRRGPDNLTEDDLSCEEGVSACSRFAYETKAGQQISGVHDWTTGTVGAGFRLPSNLSLAEWIEDHTLGRIYNYGTMVPSALLTYAAYAADTGNVVAFDRKTMGD